MKHVWYAMAALLLMLTIQRCDEDIEPVQQKTKFGFSVTTDLGPLKELPAGSRLVMSVTSQNGAPVMELQEVKWYPDKNGFVTESLTLPPGSYRISDFMVIDDNDEMLYAIPKRRSSLDGSVSHPLDFKFTISGERHPLTTDLQLLAVHRFSPADFGYRSFKILRRLLLIFVTTEGSNRPTTAKGFIINGNDTIQVYNLRARMNLVTVPEGVTSSYKLVIYKSGYATVSFALLDLLRKPYRPVRAILKPAFTMLAYIDLAASATFEFELATTESAALYIDWGDSSSGNSYDVNSERFSPRHDYAASGNYPITITGDIDKINFFYSFYGQGMIDEIDFRHLTALETIRFGLTRSPRILDLRRNSKLSFALLPGLNNLEYLYLPADHSINFIMLHGGNLMSTAAVDAVIDNIYQNSIRNNITNGWFGLAASWTQPEDDESLLGPPSPTAIEKLRYLHENYNWTLEPNPFD